MEAVLTSIQVSETKTYFHEATGEEWTSSIEKKPVDGVVFVDVLNVAGDAQTDKKNHGGKDMAVMGYSLAHYATWASEWGEDILPNGSFGENFTIDGLDEDDVMLGDIYRVGDTVRLQVTKPRQPCFKLQRILNRESIIKEVVDTNRSGWYFRVLQTGNVEAGMPIMLEDRVDGRFSITHLSNLITHPKDGIEDKRILMDLDLLPYGWRRSYYRHVERHG